MTRLDSHTRLHSKRGPAMTGPTVDRDRYVMSKVKTS
jgi:hypothetical protein